MKNKITGYYEFNEELDATESLRIFLSFYQQSKNDLYMNKWTIIALHNTIQSIFIFVLNKTCPCLELYDSKSIDNFYNTLDNPNCSHKPMKLKQFLTLAEQLEKILQVKLDREYLKKLTLYRNKFIHFTPQSHAFQIQWFNEFYAQSLSIFEAIYPFAIKKTNWFHEDYETFQNNINAVIKELK